MEMRGRPWLLAFLALACSGEKSDSFDAGGDGDGALHDGGGTDASGGGGPDGSSDQDAGGDACTTDCPCEMENVAVVADTTQAFSKTAIAWNGQGFGVAWGANVEDDDAPEIFFARLDAEGALIGTPTRITNAPRLSLAPSLVWTGSEYGLAWNDMRDNADPATGAEIYFARIGADGEKVGDDVRVTNVTGQSFRPSLTWDGAGYALSWNDDQPGDQEIYFARITAAGVKDGDDVRVTTAAGLSLFSDLAASANGFGVVWNDDRAGSTRAYFAVLDALGEPVGEALPVSELEGASYTSAIVWNGSEFAVTWTHEVGGDAQDTEIYFTRFDADGAKVGEDLRLRDAEGASDLSTLAFGGGTYGVAWRDNRDDPDLGEIYFTRVIDGVAAPAINVSLDESDSAAPHVVWDGSGFSLGFHAHLSEPTRGELRFTRLCP